MNRDSVFDRCRSIGALEVARDAGVVLQRGGGKWAAVANCPWHNDRTPSLKFDRSGGFYCFSCGAGGSDGVAFLSKLRGIRPLDAAKILVGDEPAAPVDPTIKARRERERAGLALLKAVEDWRKSFDSLLSVTLRALNDFIQGEQADDDLLWEIIQLSADLRHERDYLDAIQDSPSLMYALYREYNSQE